MSRAVMQQALDALRDSYDEHWQHCGRGTRDDVRDAIKALEAELAKPAPISNDEAVKELVEGLRAAVRSVYSAPGLNNAISLIEKYGAKHG